MTIVSRSPQQPIRQFLDSDCLLFLIFLKNSRKCLSSRESLPQISPPKNSARPRLSVMAAATRDFHGQCELSALSHRKMSKLASRAFNSLLDFPSDVCPRLGNELLGMGEYGGKKDSRLIQNSAKELTRGCVNLPRGHSHVGGGITQPRAASLQQTSSRTPVQQMSQNCFLRISGNIFSFKFKLFEIRRRRGVRAPDTCYGIGFKLLRRN